MLSCRFVFTPCFCFEVLWLTLLGLFLTVLPLTSPATFSCPFLPSICHAVTLILALRSEPPFTGVSGRSGPESAKKSQKGSFGGGGGLQKSHKKYPKKSKNTFFWTTLGIFRLFRVFSGTFLQTPQKTLSETFLRFRARRARRLL